MRPPVVAGEVIGDCQATERIVIEDAIAIRPMVYLSFVFDHRILDGASADAFLSKVKEALEGWS